MMMILSPETRKPFYASSADLIRPGLFYPRGKALFLTTTLFTHLFSSLSAVRSPERD
jgi:hypothetical protein